MKNSRAAGHTVLNLLIPLLLLTASSCGNADEKNTLSFMDEPINIDDEATRTAGKWLENIDKGEFQKAIDEADPLITKHQTGELLVQRMEARLKSYGEIEKRDLVDYAATNEVPGYPAADYVILRYVVYFKSGAVGDEIFVVKKNIGERYTAVSYEQNKRYIDPLSNLDTN